MFLDHRNDVPTGATPARQAYQYPRNLYRTRSHDELLEDFRGQQGEKVTVPACNDLSSFEDDTTKEHEKENTSLLPIATSKYVFFCCCLLCTRITVINAPVFLAPSGTSYQCKELR